MTLVSMAIAKLAANPTKKFLAVSGMSFALASLGALAGTGVAVADGTKPDSGSYDEMLKVSKSPIQQGPLTGSYHGTEGSYDDLLNILDPDGFQAARP